MRIRFVRDFILAGILFMVTVSAMAQANDRYELDIVNIQPVGKYNKSFNDAGKVYIEYTGYRLSELIPELLNARPNRFEVTALKNNPYIKVTFKSNLVDEYDAKDIILDEVVKKYKVQMFDDDRDMVVFILRDNDVYSRDYESEVFPDSGDELSSSDWGNDYQAKDLDTDDLAAIIESNYRSSVLNRSSKSYIPRVDLDFSSQSALKRSLRKVGLDIDREERVIPIKVLSNYKF